MHEWGSASLSSHGPVATDDGAGPRRRFEARRQLLAEILSDELVPSLTAKPCAATGRAARSTRADPDALARCALSDQMDEARRRIAARLRSGATAQSVALDDIGAAARRLGELWGDDDCDFFAVTFATRALSLLLRDVWPDAGLAPAEGAPSILLAMAPGETHDLGADVVAGLFRLAGWRAERCETRDIPDALASESFDVAGFSLSCDRFAGTLAGAIAEARAASRRRNLTIAVGGPIFASKPRLAKALGADVLAPGGDVGALWPQRLQNSLRL
jgi:methylmalonyl-CoA mutase cobalamin-binding subunit